MSFPLRTRVLGYGLLAALIPIIGLLVLWSDKVTHAYLADPAGLTGRLYSLFTLPWILAWVAVALLVERVWTRRSALHPAHFVMPVLSLAALELLAKPVMRGALLLSDRILGIPEDAWQTQISLFLVAMLGLLVILYQWVVPTIVSRVIIPRLPPRRPEFRDWSMK